MSHAQYINLNTETRQLKMCTRVIKLYFLLVFIGEVGVRSEQSGGIVELLSNYQGIDGNEPITPFSVIKEIYSSGEPFLLWGRGPRDQ